MSNIWGLAHWGAAVGLFAFLRPPVVLLTPTSKFEQQLASQANASPEQIFEKWKAKRRFVAGSFGALRSLFRGAAGPSEVF